MRWGFVPIWWKKTLKEVPATFNARAETVATKPIYAHIGRRYVERDVVCGYNVDTPRWAG
jgi:putative SOS response-associated peptidase YedK